MLEIAVAALPVTFLFVIGRGAGRLPTVSIAGTLLGVWWMGVAFAHAELLRRLPHGNGVLIDMHGRDVPGRHRRVSRRPAVRAPARWRPSISPNKTVEGLFCGMLVAILSVFVAGLNQTWLTAGRRAGAGHRRSR